MSIILFLIPLGLVLLAIALWAFVWAVDNEQFDDLDRAAHRILFDDDEEAGPTRASPVEPRAETTRQAGEREPRD